jgi:hypothetical protein
MADTSNIETWFDVFYAGLSTHLDSHIEHGIILESQVDKALEWRRILLEKGMVAGPGEIAPALFVGRQSWLNEVFHPEDN